MNEPNQQSIEERSRILAQVLDMGPDDRINGKTQDQIFKETGEMMADMVREKLASPFVTDNIL